MQTGTQMSARFLFRTARQKLSFLLLLPPNLPDQLRRVCTQFLEVARRRSAPDAGGSTRVTVTDIQQTDDFAHVFMMFGLLHRERERK